MFAYDAGSNKSSELFFDADPAVGVNEDGRVELVRLFGDSRRVDEMINRADRIFSVLIVGRLVNPRVGVPWNLNC